MAGYIGSKASVVSSGAERKKTFAITTTTTALTGLVYTPTKVHVFHNGVRLVDGTDFTATNSTSITLTVAAESGDQVVVVSYASFQTSDTVSASAGGTFSGDVNFGANATFGDNDKAIFGAGSDLQIYHDGSHSYVSDQGTGNIKYRAASRHQFENADGSKMYIQLVGDTVGQEYVQLRYNNATKLATTSTGINVTGKATLTSGELTFSGSISDPNGAAYIWRPADNTLAFGTANEERMRITSAGSVGIGNSSPNTKLDVIGSSTNGSGVVDTIRLRNTGTSANDGPRLQFTAGTSTSGAAIASQGKALNSADLVFYAGGNTERMRIDASGNVLVGKTVSSSNIAGIRMAGSAAPGYAELTRSGGNPLYLNRQVSTGEIVRFDKDGSQKGSISVSTSATAYNTSSDYRLKTDAQPMTGASARVQALNPVNFEWLSDGSRVDGFLAHEAQAVVPEAVHGTKDAMKDEEYEVTPAVLDDDGNETTAAVMGTRSVPDYQGIDQSKLVPLLTAALQEALTKIDDMETRLAALEGN